MSYLMFILLIVANAPVYYLIIRFFFDDIEDLCEAIYYYFRPTILSALKGEYWEDQWASTKLTVCVMACVALTCAEYYYASKYFPRYFPAIAWVLDFIRENFGPIRWPGSTH